MPIYEYRCKSCGHEMEKLQKISDAPLVDCPQCGQPELTKLISAAAFRLKGGGWYETDFKKDNKRNLAGDGHRDAGSGDGSSSKKESKGDSGSGDSGGDAKGGSKSTGKSDSKSAGSSSSGQAA